ncbi:hypothetical protein VCUG_01518 [Vavraia culicis subsp. floridensis]|uniref:Cullin family profile domain-containing protein n=1 Tax=Vavraia culicis (isolate floridensis) TaxID=948595 RepID=L2GUG0_VAVCU|nr:uncharacterized protein VCUG_01518 [Vavraia culicis subsp. floridensis]ELA46987.1 hypothetical protein VCUG_01518 [Vavraia culicis subsp. floridensis]
MDIPKNKCNLSVLKDQIIRLARNKTISAVNLYDSIFGLNGCLDAVRDTVVGGVVEECLWWYGRIVDGYEGHVEECGCVEGGSDDGIDGDGVVIDSRDGSRDGINTVKEINTGTSTVNGSSASVPFGAAHPNAAPFDDRAIERLPPGPYINTCTASPAVLKELIRRYAHYFDAFSSFISNLSDLCFLLNTERWDVYEMGMDMWHAHVLDRLVHFGDAVCTTVHVSDSAPDHNDTHALVHVLHAFMRIKVEHSTYYALTYEHALFMRINALYTRVALTSNYAHEAQRIITHEMANRTCYMLPVSFPAHNQALISHFVLPYSAHIIEQCIRYFDDYRTIYELNDGRTNALFERGMAAYLRSVRIDALCINEQFERMIAHFWDRTGVRTVVERYRIVVVERNCNVERMVRWIDGLVDGRVEKEVLLDGAVSDDELGFVGDGSGPDGITGMNNHVDTNDMCINSRINANSTCINNEIRANAGDAKPFHPTILQPFLKIMPYTNTDAFIHYYEKKMMNRLLSHVVNVSREREVMEQLKAYFMPNLFRKCEHMLGDLIRSYGLMEEYERGNEYVAGRNAYKRLYVGAIPNTDSIVMHKQNNSDNKVVHGQDKSDNKVVHKQNNSNNKDVHKQNKNDNKVVHDSSINTIVLKQPIHHRILTSHMWPFTPRGIKYPPLHELSAFKAFYSAMHNTHKLVYDYELSTMDVRIGSVVMRINLVMFAVLKKGQGRVSELVSMMGDRECVLDNVGRMAEEGVIVLDGDDYVVSEWLCNGGVW